MAIPRLLNQNFGLQLQKWKAMK